MQYRALQSHSGTASAPAALHAVPTEAEVLFSDAADFYAAIESDIRRARSSICVEMYIWSNDEVGLHFFGLLEEAARRGVQVRLLIDGVGSFFWIRAQQARMRASPVETRIFRPVDFRRLRKMGGIPAFFGRLNRRNHKKVVVIDEAIAYSGSINVTRSSLAWKEMGVRVEGAPASLLQDLFEDAWQSATGSRDLARSFRLQGALLSSRILRSNQTLLLREAHARGLRRRIRKAEKRVWLMTPYFVPTLGLFLAILGAARRGVDVRVVLPRKSDVCFVRWVARLYYRYMIKAGVKLYEWLPSVLHAKATLVDDWATVGSSNLNRRSAYLDLELDVVLGSPASVAGLAEEFEKAYRLSDRIRAVSKPGLLRGLLAELFYLGRRWL